LGNVDVDGTVQIVGLPALFSCRRGWCLGWRSRSSLFDALFCGDVLVVVAVECRSFGDVLVVVAVECR
jgi:hypothetical protein